MQVQIVFNKDPIFSLGKKLENNLPSWFDFQVLCIIMAIAQGKNSRVIETTKQDICQIWGKTIQGKNYKWIGQAMDNWNVLSCQKKGKKLEVTIDQEFFEESKKRGQIWDLEKILAMNGVVFRMTQIFSCGLYHQDTLKYYPSSLCKMIPLQAEKEYVARKKIISRMEDVFYELKKRGFENCSYTRAREKGRVLIYVSNKNPYLQIKDPPPEKPQREEIKKAVKVGETVTAKIVSSIQESAPKEEHVIHSFDTEKTTTNTKKSQGSFDEACSFYESISSDFDRGSLRNYSDSVVNNWEFHKEAIKFCCPGQLPTRTYSGRKICGWYKSGAKKGEFASYVEEKNKELAKKRSKEQTPELKEKMFSTVIDLLKSCSDDGKRMLARRICNNVSITNKFDALNEFNSAAINKCLESSSMQDYRKSGYDNLINSLFIWNEFGKVMKADLPKSWWPTFDLKHEIKREDKPELRAVDKSQSLFQKQINAAERLRQAHYRRITEEVNPETKEAVL